MKSSFLASRLSDRRVLIPLGLILLLVVGGVVWALLPSGPDRTVAATEYTVLKQQDVVAKIPVSATVESRHTVALSAPFTGAVEAVHVRVGDTVQEGQVLAEIDVSDAQKEIDAQLSQQIATDATNLTQVEQAQQQHRQLQDSVEQGLNPEVTAAEAALRQADAQYAEAEQLFVDKQDLVDRGADTELHSQAAAVEGARRDVYAAALEAARAGMVTVNTALAADADAVSPVLGELQADARYDGANRTLTTAQETYDNTLRSVDQQLATQQRAVSQAFSARTDAAVALEAAKLGVRHQLATTADAVDQAWRGLQAAQSAAGQSVSRLQVDVAGREARAPISGVVIAVGAEEGTPAAGPLATIADPERLILRTTVKEVDAGRVGVGNEVTFTTPSTGSREYNGRVLSVSPVAQAPPVEAGPTPRPEFPVEIEVTGNRSDLRLGGSAKAQVITERAKKTLAVPREALLEESGSYQVLVLRPVDGGHEVTQVPVTVGVLTDFEASIAGVRTGDVVLNQAANYRDSIGQQVRVEDAEQ